MTNKSVLFCFFAVFGCSLAAQTAHTVFESKKAIELEPEDKDAKQNLEFVLEEINPPRSW